MFMRMPSSLLPPSKRLEIVSFLLVTANYCDCLLLLMGEKMKEKRRKTEKIKGEPRRT